MEFRIEKKTSFNLIGVTKKVPVQFEGVNQSIVELAQSITAQQREEMHEMEDLYPQKALNITDGFSDKWLNEQGYLNHMIGFASSKNNQYSDLEQITVKESD
ncbi:GyrI-like domain-containing protein [Lactococcus lactis subsp. lactis]